MKFRWGGVDMENVTVLVHKWQAGDSESREVVFGMLHQHLVQSARGQLRKYGCITLQPGDVANEAIVRMLGSDASYSDRTHLLAVAALRMRGVLVDHLRSKFAGKRGANPLRVTLSLPELKSDTSGEPFEVLALNQTLDQLSEFDERAAQVIEMTYFGGMSRKEIATALDVSIPTVDRDLLFGRTWLSRELAS